MPLSDRAAQFAPFAALSGHSAALVETARLTDQRMELDEDARAALDSKQQLLLERIKERPEITVTWFQPDAKKDGGRYIFQASLAPLPVSAVVASPCDNGHTSGITLHAPIYADCTGGFKSAWYGCSVCDHQVDTSGNDVPWSPSSCPD